MVRLAESAYDLPQVVLGHTSFAYLRAPPCHGSRPIVTAAFLLLCDKPQTSSWLAAVVELCRYMLCAGERACPVRQGWTAVWCPFASAAGLQAIA